MLPVTCVIIVLSGDFLTHICIIAVYAAAMGLYYGLCCNGIAHFHSCPIIKSLPYLEFGNRVNFNAALFRHAG